MPSENSTWVTITVFLMVIGAVIAGGGLLWFTRPAPVEITIIPPQPTPTRQPTPTPAPIMVYVTGAVANAEQLYTLPPGSRVTDAINAAGGVTDEADTTRVNLADKLRDGDQVHVPERAAITGPPGAGAVDSAATVQAELALATPIGGEIVNINTATATELTVLPGIGPVTAERIVIYREANGPFTELIQLDDIEGIGPATLENIASQVVFD